MAGGGGGGAGVRSLEDTSTWAVAVVCFVLVSISIFIEQVLHYLGKFLMKHQKRALYEALEKVKSELMLLGFVSLLLTVVQSLIPEICVSRSVGDSWTPCDKRRRAANYYDDDNDDQHGRKLLRVVHGGRRFLVGGGGGVDKCAEKGKVPLISTDGVNQLHVFIFVLAVSHVLYTISTMLLGKLKTNRWKTWEKETETLEYQFSHDPERFRFARETSFGRRHLSSWSKSSILIWIVCFFRQFTTSVSKADYLTLRHGFITAHLPPQSSMNFNFQKYIERSLEEDFQVVVGIREGLSMLSISTYITYQYIMCPLMWFFAVLFLLFNTDGWYSYYWLPFIPLIILLMVGVKLQVVITRMALRIMEHDDVVKGVPIVHPADNLFWFNRPKLLLNLIHFVIFQNAFHVAFFVWTWYEFGIKSCFHEETELIIIIVTMGVVIHILCSYITLPLYTLVIQMGTNMKPVIFNDRVASAMKSRQRTARKHVKESRKSGTITPTPSTTSQLSTPSHNFSSSPVHLLRGYRSDNCYNFDIERLENGKGSQNQFYFTEGSSSSHDRSGNKGKSGMVDDETGIHAAASSSPMVVMEEHPEPAYSSFSFDKRRKR